MTLNSKQKLVLNTAILLLITVVLFPNWKSNVYANYAAKISESRSLGHSFIFIPPKAKLNKYEVLEATEIDFARTSFYTISLLLVSGGLMFSFKGEKTTSINYPKLFGYLVLCFGGIGFIYTTYIIGNLDFEATSTFKVGMYLLPGSIAFIGWLMLYKTQSNDPS